jgi:hypothetical protein
MSNMQPTPIATFSRLGNVGINTSIPAEKLHVNSGNMLLTNNYAYKIYNPSGTGVSVATISNGGGGVLTFGEYSNSLNTTELMIPGGSPTSVLNFMSNMQPTPIATFSRLGNVGINTSIPAEKLHVNSGNMLLTNNYAYKIYNPLGTGVSVATISNGGGGVLTFGEYSNSLNTTELMIPGGSPTSVLNFMSNMQPTPIATFSRLGNVGINTSIPAEKLHVNSGNILLTNNYAYKIYNPSGTGVSVATISNGGGGVLTFGETGSNLNLAELMIPGGSPTSLLNIVSSLQPLPVATFSRGGNVGIGTNIPFQKLHVAGSVIIPNGSIYTSFNASSQQVPVIGASGNDIVIGQIGNANYVSTHIVGGAAGSSSFVSIDNNSGTSVLYVASGTNGNTGIGTTVPGSRLHVVGGGTGSAALQLRQRSFESFGGCAYGFQACNHCG